MAYDPIEDGQARERWENAKRLNPRLKVGQKDEPVKYYPQPGPRYAGQKGNRGCVILLGLAAFAVYALWVMLGGG